MATSTTTEVILSHSRVVAHLHKATMVSHATSNMVVTKVKDLIIWFRGYIATMATNNQVEGLLTVPPLYVKFVQNKGILPFNATSLRILKESTHSDFNVYASRRSSIADPLWYLDTGSTHHLTSDLTNLSLHAQEYNNHASIECLPSAFIIKDLTMEATLLHSRTKNGFYA